MVQKPGRLARALDVLAAALGVVALAACGAATPQGAGGGTAPAAIEAVMPYGGDPATEGTPQPGGRLRIGTDRDPASFDPTVQNANPAAFAVYDSLSRSTPTQ